MFIRKANGLPVAEPRIVVGGKDLARLGLPVLGILPARASILSEAKRKLAAHRWVHRRVDHGRFAAEAVLGGTLLLWVVLALLQPGFADSFFDQPARAIADVASRF